jgi:hypothetical protein
MYAIFGDKDKFAIEVEIVYASEYPILGHFRFWAGGTPIGDWEDSTHLNGCRSWLRDFVEKEVDRREPWSDSVPAEEVMKMLWDDVMPGPPRPDGSYDIPSIEEVMFSSEIVRRYHISHFGMSSFDRVRLLLTETADGRQRLVWRDKSSPEIHEAFLDPGELQRVSEQFCDWFDETTEGLPGATPPTHS